MHYSLRCFIDGNFCYRRSRYDRKRPLRPDEIEELANRSDDSLSIEDPYSSDDSVIDETYSPKGHHVDSDEDDYSDDSEIEAEVAENATDFNQDIDPDLGWEDTDFDHEVDFYGQPAFNINLPKDVPPIKIFEFFFGDDIIKTVVDETNRRANTFF